MHKVSVIITSYNHDKYLKKRIESVLAQTYTDYKIKIYDDCSTDNSRDIIEQYRGHPKVEEIVYNDKNSGGLFKQWEKSIPEATGKWIWIAQSDDYADEGFLETLVGLAEDRVNIGVAFCGSRWVNEQGEEGADLSLYNNSFFRSGLVEIRKKLGKQCSVQNASAAIIKRDLAVDAVKGIGKYAACGDWIFYLRILQCSNIVYTGKKLNYFRWYHNNVSNSAKESGRWVEEGLDVFENMNYKKIGFSIKEFYLLIRWWTGLIYRADIKNKRKKYNIIFKAIFRYFSLLS